MRTQKTKRRTTRRLRRYTSRMLGGVRRPPPTDWLNLAGRALNEAIRIDASLRPFLREQQRLREQEQWREICESALRKVYGPPDPNAAGTAPGFTPAVDVPQLLEDERALAKSQALLALLETKLARKR